MDIDLSLIYTGEIIELIRSGIGRSPHRVNVTPFVNIIKWKLGFDKLPLLNTVQFILKLRIAYFSDSKATEKQAHWQKGASLYSNPPG